MFMVLTSHRHTYNVTYLLHEKMTRCPAEGSTHKVPVRMALQL
jgi:hypothetical protein